MSRWELTAEADEAAAKEMGFVCLSAESPLAHRHSHEKSATTTIVHAAHAAEGGQDTMFYHSSSSSSSSCCSDEPIADAPPSPPNAMNSSEEETPSEDGMNTTEPPKIPFILHLSSAEGHLATRGGEGQEEREGSSGAIETLLVTQPGKELLLVEEVELCEQQLETLRDEMPAADEDRDNTTKEKKDTVEEAQDWMLELAARLAAGRAPGGEESKAAPPKKEPAKGSALGGDALNSMDDIVLPSQYF